jgi:hypothetical protein
MSDALKAQAGSLRAGLDKIDDEIKTREDELERIKGDRLAMAKELGSVERFLDAEGVALP